MLRLAALVSLALIAGSARARAPVSPAPGVGAALHAREKERDSARTQAGQVAREIDDLRRQLVALGAAEHMGERRVGSDRSRLALLAAREAELSQAIGRNHVQLARLLGALETYRRNPPPALLVEPRSAKDAVRAAILLRAITPALVARSRAFKAQADDLARVRRGAAEADGDLFQAESAIADRRGRIERLIAEKRGLERRLYSDAARAEAQARRLAERARSMGELVDTLATRAGAEGSGAPTRLLPPVQGVVDRRFGEAWPGHGRSRGWTWRALAGAVVLSPAEGRVDYVGPLKDWGGVAILQVGGGARLVLAGLASAGVAVGRTVAAGEPIGRLPDQRGAPAELYLELREGGRAVDPGSLLGLRAINTSGARSSSP